MAEEITPTLEKRRQEATQYHKWVANQTEVDRLQRFVTAYNYYTHIVIIFNFDFLQFNKIFLSKELLKQSGDVDGIEQDINKLTQANKELELNIKKYQKKASILSNKKEKEIGTELKEFEIKEVELSKELVKANSAHSNKQKTYQGDQDQLNISEKKLHNIEKEIEKKKISSEDASKEYQDLCEESSKTREQILMLQQKIQSISAGVSSDVNDSKSFTDQLLDAKKEHTLAKTEQKQLELKIKHQIQELDEKKKLIKGAEKSLETLNKEEKEHQNKISSLEKELSLINFDPKKQVSIKEDLQKKREEYDEITQKLEILSAKFSNFNFT